MIKNSLLPVLIVIIALFLFPHFAPQSSETTVISYYYIWYRSDSDWTDKVTQTPLLNYYNSENPDIIQDHVRWARHANIDCFAISYWGKNDERSNAFPTIIQTLENDGFKYCIMIETDSEDFASSELLNTELEYIVDNYADNQYYLKADGKPVLMIFDNPSDVSTWVDVKESYSLFSYWLILKMTVEDNVITSLGNITNIFDVVDVYTPLMYSFGMSYDSEIPSEDAVKSGLQAYFAQKFFWNQQTRYSSIAVQLGFNNTVYATSIQDREAVSIPFYQTVAESYADVLQKDYVLFCSFNEWYETTSCEPSLEEDYKYLNILKELLP